GQGDLEAGLFAILQGGKKAIEAQLVGPETHVTDVLEEYRGQLERITEEGDIGQDIEVSQAGTTDAESGGLGVEGNAQRAEEAGDFQLSGEGSRDTTPIVEPYQPPDRIPPKKRIGQRQPQLEGLPEDMDESV